MTAYTETQKRILIWLPVVYLFTVAGFHVDGWYHAVVGRDQFWIAPHFFVMAGQIAATVLACMLFVWTPEAEKDTRRRAGWYFVVQIIFFVGLAFDQAWHQILGQETINTALVFWGPPHFVIALSLLLTPFLLARFIRETFEGGERVMLTVITFATLFSFIDFYFQPLWPLGPFHVLGAYGEAAILALLGFVLFWALYYLKEVSLAAITLTLISLSVAEIMSWGALADTPRVSSVFGTVTAYPFWLTFFSFFIAAAFLDLSNLRKLLSPEIKGALWGGVQACLYALGAKLWADLSPHSFYPGWKAFPGLVISWSDVLLFTVLGMLGGAIGFLLCSILQSKIISRDS